MRKTPSVTQRCTSTRRDGTPCTAQAGASGYCIGHDPGALDARRKGGHATSRAERAGKLLPARLQPVVALLENAMGEVHRGELDPRAASAMVSLAGALVRREVKRFLRIRSEHVGNGCPGHIVKPILASIYEVH